MKPIASPRNFSHVHLLLGGAICITAYEIILGAVNPDETEALHTAWKIFTGESIYADFFQHHHPLFYYLLIPVIAIGGESISTFFMAELFAVAILAGIVVTTYRLAGKIYGDRRIALLSIVLLFVFPWFITRGTHIRPDTPQVLLGLLSFWFIVLWLDGGARRHLLLSALLLSLSFLVLQKAVFLIFVVGLILLHRLFAAGGDGGGARMTPRDFLLYWAFFSLPPMLYVAYLFMAGDFRDYFDFNWLINMKYKYNFSVFSIFIKKVDVLLSMVGFTVLFIAGCFAGPPRNAGAHRAVVLAGICLIASLFLARAPYPQYLLMAMPFVCIVAAAALRHVFSGAKAKWIVSILFLLYCVEVIENTRGGADKRETIAAMRHVLEVSEPEDVYFGYRKPNLFRRNADFFWFCFTPGKCLDTLQSFREYDWDPVQIIGQTRPRVIGVESAGLQGELYAAIMEHPAVAAHYQRSPAHPEIYTRKEVSSERTAASRNPDVPGNGDAGGRLRRTVH